MELEKGLITFPDAHVEGEPYEWLGFEVVRNLAAARDEQKVKAAPAKLAVVVFFIFVAVVCYLAYRGLRTF